MGNKEYKGRKNVKPKRNEEKCKTKKKIKKNVKPKRDQEIDMIGEKMTNTEER